MNNILEYLVSFGIVGVGIVWIAAANKAGSPLFPAWITLGILTIAVGLISILAETRNRMH